MNGSGGRMIGLSSLNISLQASEWVCGIDKRLPLLLLSLRFWVLLFRWRDLGGTTTNLERRVFGPTFEREDGTLGGLSRARS